MLALTAWQYGFGVLFLLFTVYVVGITVRGEPRACPWCDEVVRKDARVCKHCGRDLGALADA